MKNYSFWYMFHMNNRLSQYIAEHSLAAKMGGGGAGFDGHFSTYVTL